MGDLCFWSPEGARGLAPGGLACRACWWRRLALHPHWGFYNELKARGSGGGRQAVDGFQMSYWVCPQPTRRLLWSRQLPQL